VSGLKRRRDITFLALSLTPSFAAACSPTLAFKPRIDAVDFSIFLAWNRKPFDEAGNLDSNNRVALNGNVWWIARSKTYQNK
jgi:hypothetical protein